MQDPHGSLDGISAPDLYSIWSSTHGTFVQSTVDCVVISAVDADIKISKRIETVFIVFKLPTELVTGFLTTICFAIAVL